MSDRKIITNIKETQLSNNKILTSKYTILNFLPLNLYHQFKKLANVYFLIAGFCQMIPEISTSNGQPIVLAPLL